MDREYETVTLARQDGIAIMTLNRAERRNAFDRAMVEEILAALDDVANDADVRVLIVTGAGQGFCAGADIRPDSWPIKTVGDSREGARLCAAIPRKLRLMPKPAVAAVNGAAVGGGINLALSCDLIVASEAASFGVVFPRLGLTLDMGASYFLPRLLGPARACELALTGKMIDAREAERIGLVNRVVASDMLLPAARELALSLAANAPMALRFTKELIYRGMESDLDAAIEAEVEYQGTCRVSNDAKEGFAAWLEKRAPKFTGS